VTANTDVLPADFIGEKDAQKEKAKTNEKGENTERKGAQKKRGVIMTDRQLRASLRLANALDDLSFHTAQTKDDNQ